MTIQIDPSAYGTNDSAFVYRNLFTEGALSWSSQTAAGQVLDVVVNSNPGFDSGLSGWAGGSPGAPVSPPTGVVQAYNGRASAYVRNDLAVDAGMYQPDWYPLTPGRKYQIHTWVSATGAGTSNFYCGYIRTDVNGNTVGSNQGRVYNAANNVSVAAGSGWILYTSPVFTLDDVRAGGNEAAVGIRVMGRLNHNNVAGYVMGVDGMWLKDVSQLDSDGSAANALGPQTGDAWVPASIPAWLHVSATQPHRADCVAIIAHTIGSSGNTLIVEASRNGGTTWVRQTEMTPADDKDIFILFDSNDLTGFADWRIRLINGVAPAIGIAWIGPRLFVPMGVQSSYTPINLAADIVLTTSSSITGQYVASYIERKGGGTAIQLAPQARNWVQSDASDFIAHYNSGKPFLWLSCPDRMPDDAHYCWRAGPVMGASFSTGSQWVDVSLEVNAYVS